MNNQSPPILTPRRSQKNGLSLKSNRISNTVQQSEMRSGIMNEYFICKPPVPGRSPLMQVPIFNSNGSNLQCSNIAASHTKITSSPHNRYVVPPKNRCELDDSINQGTSFSIKGTGSFVRDENCYPRDDRFRDRVSSSNQNLRPILSGGGPTFSRKFPFVEPDRSLLSNASINSEPREQISSIDGSVSVHRRFRVYRGTRLAASTAVTSVGNILPRKDSDVMDSAFNFKQKFEDLQNSQFDMSKRLSKLDLIQSAISNLEDITVNKNKETCKLQQKLEESESEVKRLREKNRKLKLLNEITKARFSRGFDDPLGKSQNESQFRETGDLDPNVQTARLSVAKFELSKKDTISPQTDKTLKATTTTVETTNQLEALLQKYRNQSDLLRKIQSTNTELVERLRKVEQQSRDVDMQKQQEVQLLEEEKVERESDILRMIEENEKLDKEVMDLKKQLSRINSCNEQSAATLSLELDRIREKFQCTETSLEHHKNCLNKTRKELIDERREKEELSMIISQSEDRNKTLLSQLNKLEAENTDLRIKVQNLQSGFEDIYKDRNSLKTALSDLESQNAITENKLATAQSLASSLKETIASLRESNSSSLSANLKQISTLKIENSTLSSRLSTAEDSNSRLTSQTSFLQAELSRLNALLTSKHKECSEAQIARESMERRLYRAARQSKSSKTLDSVL